MTRSLVGDAILMLMRRGLVLVRLVARLVLLSPASL